MLATDCRRALVMALACSALACAHNPAPHNWLGPAEAEEADPYGAWIVISRIGGDTSDVSGEFLGVDRDSVFVLTQDSLVRAVPTDSVRTAQIAFYDSQYGEVVAWSLLGSLSTLSNGAYLLFTFPMWAIDGMIASTNQSLAPIREVDDAAGWDAVRMYARFPGGIPDNLPRTLPPKPLRRAERVRKR